MQNSPGPSPRELTLRGLLLGSVLGVIFAASSVYLGLKVGLTVSASIPVAVLSITLFRWLQRGLRLPSASLLENNIVQTTGSAGESIAAGVAFTLPSLLLMGFELELSRTLLVALLGGLIGVLMMIPLRHGLIVQEHGKLSYPEGTACADVLLAGEKGGTNARTVFLGFFVGVGYASLNLISRLWKDVAEFAIDLGGRLQGAVLAFEVSPPMLGVGYIIGPRIAANMMAGGALSFLVLVPLIHIFGDSRPDPMYPETTRRIADMSPYAIRNAYILYIGAGAVATGGFIALARAVPTIGAAFAGGLRNLRSGRNGGPGPGAPTPPRTAQDLPMTLVAGGSLALIAAIWLAPGLGINLLSAFLILLFGFFFVTVSSRITGEIGSSSNPISGMTVATLLITCGLFVAVGRTGVDYKAMALTTAALVCVAASVAGATSQDLKTGFLVGGTPRLQQIAISVGVITSAVVIGFILLQLNRGATTHQAVAAPGYTATTFAAGTEPGPDGQRYRVHYVREDATLPGGNVSRGKYLVDDRGQLRFLVDPGVCGTVPYRWEREETPSRVVVPPNAPQELGPDHVRYYVVTGGDARRLATADGQVAWRARAVAKFDAPKAQLFRLIIDGTLGGRLPWGLVLVGVLLAVLMELVGVAALPFAVGLYLPISTSAGIFVGGIVRWLVDRRRGLGNGASADPHADFSPGMLMASGLIAGGAITGVLQSIVETVPAAKRALDFSGLFPLAHVETWWPMVPFVAMAVALYAVAVRRNRA